MKRYIEALPQAPPFRFVDELETVESMQHAKGSVRFDPGHRVFEGHLPDRPLVPGVILIEALAQLSGIVLIEPGAGKAAGYLAEVDHMRFRRAVAPGERVELHAKLTRRLGSAATFEVSAHVGDALVAEGSLILGGLS